MNARILLLAGLLVASPEGVSATNAPPASVLSFLDGSLLLGEMVSYDAASGLRWRHPGARQPMEFLPGSLHQLRLGSLVPDRTNAAPLCRVRLANGDELEGTLVSLDASHLELDTWFAGRIRGRRSGLAHLSLLPADHATAYEGPQAADEWLVSGAPVAAEVRAINIAPIIRPGFLNLNQLIAPGRQVEKKVELDDPIAPARPAVPVRPDVPPAPAVPAAPVAPVQPPARAIRAVPADPAVPAPPAAAAFQEALARAMIEMPARGEVVAPAAGARVTNTWIFRDGAYYSTALGTLGRDCKLPPRVRIEFDMAWRGQPFFRFAFFSRSIDRYDFIDGYSFYTSTSGFLYHMRRAGAGPGASSLSARVPALVSKSAVRLSFLIDTEKETTVLLADGERLHEWKGMGPPGPGTGVLFYNYNVNSRIRLGNIRITAWDGQFHLEPGPGDPNETVVQFVNRDRATGGLHAIRDGRLTLTAAENSLDIPLARIATVRFPTGARPEEAGPAAQLNLPRSARLTLQLEKWEGGRVTGTSPVFGPMTLDAAAVRGARFNPGATRPPSEEVNWLVDDLLLRP